MRCEGVERSLWEHRGHMIFTFLNKFIPSSV